MAAGESMRAVARRLGRSPSTVSRELFRNGGGRCYRAAVADHAAWDRACRPKPCKLATNARLREAVAVKLGEDWSPQQIAGWLVRTFPDSTGDVGVARDDLSDPVRAGPWCAQA